MDFSFLIKLGLTFFVGGVWVTLTSIVAERAGSRIGGWMGGLPMSVVVSLFFIGLSQSPQDAVQATSIIPLAISLDGLFLVMYALLAPYGFALGLVGAFLVWFCLATIPALLQWADFGLSMLFFPLALGLMYYGLGRMNLQAPGRGRIVHTRTEILIRALFSGGVMAATVVVSKYAGPILGGTLAVFPVVFVLTLIITYRTCGLEFSRAVTRPLMVSGMVNVTVYAAAVRFLYPVAGLELGTILAYAISLGSAYLTFVFIQHPAA